MTAKQYAALPYISQRIIMLREAAGWTPYRLAKASGVGTDTIYRLESGKRTDVSFITMAKIATALKVSLDQFSEPS